MITNTIHQRENTINETSIMSDDVFLRIYTYKSEFYSDYEEVLGFLKKKIENEDQQHLLGACLGELIDNAFSHNLGRRPTNHGPRVILLITFDTHMHVSTWDYGIGFSGTLRDNFPDLQNEYNYIQKALIPGTTGRYEQRGGNGLVFLQRNVFNGFQGKLYIRSLNTLVEIISEQKTVIIDEHCTNNMGSHIYFIITLS